MNNHHQEEEEEQPDDHYQSSSLSSSSSSTSPISSLSTQSQSPSTSIYQTTRSAGSSPVRSISIQRGSFSNQIHSSLSPIKRPRRSISSSLINTLRSRSHTALNSLRLTSTKIFPSEPRSFIKDTTSLSRKRAILSIALRKGLSFLLFIYIVVFFSVHGVLSTTWFALALVRGKGLKNDKTSQFINQRLGGHSRRNRLLQVLIDTLRSPSTARLAGLCGLYSSLWTLTYSFLRKLEHKYSYWNAFIAGSLCGISFFAQSKADRKELAPSVLCRGLYSVLMCYPLCHFKYGDMLLFALSNAQMAIGFLLYPTTLPAWYVLWISRVGQLNLRFVDLNRRLDRSLLPDDPANLLKTYERLIYRDTHPRTWKNECRIQSWLSSPHPTLRKGAPCALNHYRLDSCLLSNANLVLSTIINMSPTYAILHLVPALIFRSKVLMKSPLTFIGSIIKKTASSALFLATFVSVVQNCFCVPSQLYEKFGIVIRGAKLHAFIGFCTGISLLWEEPKRRGELALYCAPKALYSLWAVLKAKRLVKSVKCGDILVSSMGCGMLMHCFMHRKERMPGLARGIISQLIDPHTPDRRHKLKPSQPLPPAQDQREHSQHQL